MANSRPGCSGLSCEGVEPPPSSLGARGTRRQQGTVRWGNEAAQSCPALSLQKFHFIPDWDFLGPSWGRLSLPLPTRAQNRAFPAFVQPPFCSLPCCSTFILSSWGWAKPNYASSSPVRYLKDLQREKVHFSWNILNNLSCMAYLKKKMPYINLSVHSGISSIIPGVKSYLRYLCARVYLASNWSVICSFMGRIHFENPFWKLNSGGGAISTYLAGSPKSWDMHQLLLQCLLHPAFQIAF